MKRKRWLLILALTWAALPWVFWGVYQFHSPDHADAFWLPAMPFILISFIPMWVGHGTADPNWFPLAWVIGSSIFNLTVGALLVIIVSGMRRQPDA